MVAGRGFLDHIPSSAERVPSHTAPRFNRRIKCTTKANILYYSHHPDLIEERLQQLDEEWDIERVLETQAAALALAGTVLGTLVDRRWFALPAIVGGFLLQHAVQGWAPPLPFLRSFGVRTTQEIEAERYALKALRGDFRDIAPGDTGALAAATDRL